MRCSPKYKQYLGLVIFLIICVVIGVPTALVVFLWRNRRKIQKNDPAFTKRWGALFSSYRPQFAAIWEVCSAVQCPASAQAVSVAQAVILIRRTALLILSTSLFLYPG